MCNGRRVSTQPVHSFQHAIALPGHRAPTATTHNVQLTAVDIDTVVSASQGEAVIARRKLNFGYFRLGVTSEGYLGDAVVVAAVGEGVGEVVHGEGARGGTHGDEGVGLVDVAAPGGGLYCVSRIKLMSQTYEGN